MENLLKPTIIVGGKAGALICKDMLVHVKFLQTFFDRSKFNDWYFLEGTIDDNIEALKNHAYFVATGDNDMREEITNEIIKKTKKYPINLIHPKAWVSHSVTNLGYGNLILAGSVIHTNAKIGNGCIINTNATVEHDNVIGDYSQISPGATLCGYVEVGHHSFISANATVIPNVKIAPRVTVGAGAVVLKDIEEENCLYAGVPAERKKSYEGRNF